MCIYVEYDSAKAARSAPPRAADGIYVRICDICISIIYNGLECNICICSMYYSATAGRVAPPRAAKGTFTCICYVCARIC